MKNTNPRQSPTLNHGWLDGISQGTDEVSREQLRSLERGELEVLRTRTNQRTWAIVRGSRMIVCSKTADGLTQVSDRGAFDDDVDPLAPRNLAEQQAAHDFRFAAREDEQHARAEALLRQAGPRRLSHLRVLED